LAHRSTSQAAVTLDERRRTDACPTAAPDGRTVPDGGTIPEDRVDYDQGLHRSWRLSHPPERDRRSKYSMQM
jgi:hypothetical protein